MAELTGTVSGTERQQLWESRRVFFCTPQVFENDLDAGRCAARDFVCLVLDEAHKAQGDYAYVNVVRKIAAQTERFRVLALTATPGSDRAKIQRVITNLRIARVEVRHEDDPCLQRYMHAREMETVLVQPNKHIDMLQKQALALAATLMQSQPLRSYLPRGMPAEKLVGDTSLLNDACEKWHRKRSTLAPKVFMALETAHRRLCSVVKAVELLAYEGFDSFFLELRSFAQKEQSVDDGNYLQLPRFGQLWTTVVSLNARSEPILHPKQESLCGILLNHFANHGEDTKAIVFAQYRRVVAGIESTLNRHKPLIRARCFVGQAASKGSAGMNQLEQRQLVEQFKSGHGDCNVLVATSIGEEGLDIGEVDLIVQYDCLSSHIRTVQRIGRTGRKRNGRAIQLVTAGIEEEALVKQKKAANMIKKVLGRNSKWTYHSGGNFRMLPSPLPDPELSHVDLAPPDHGCTADHNEKFGGQATQGTVSGSSPSQHGTCTISTTQTRREVKRRFDGGDQCPETESVSPITLSTSTRLSKEERAVFLRRFVCRSPPVDLSLDNVMSQFPDACAVLTNTFRCAHTVLTNLLVSTAKDAQRRRAGTDQTRFQDVRTLTSSCHPLPKVSDENSDSGADQHLMHRANKGGHGMCVSKRDDEEELSYGAGLSTQDAGRCEMEAVCAHSVKESASDVIPDSIAGMLQMPKPLASRAVFCPQEIRHLLPECVDLGRFTTSCDDAQHRDVEIPKFRTPSYASSLNDHSVRPPPDIPRDVVTFICGSLETMNCSPSRAARKVTSTSGGQVCSPGVASHPEDARSHNTKVHTTLQATAAGSRLNGELRPIGKLTARDTGSTVELATRHRTVPTISNSAHGSTVITTSTCAASAPTVNRGLTEEQRRRIAENRKKAQARRAAVQAKQAAQQQSHADRSFAGEVQDRESHARPHQSAHKNLHDAETSSKDTSLQWKNSQREARVEQDSEIELGFSSPSPVATKRLRKRRLAKPDKKNPKKSETRSKPTSRGRAPAKLDEDGSVCEDESSQDTSPHKRRRTNAKRGQQASNKRFADDEAVVSGDDASADETDGYETDGRNSLEAFLDDGQSQSLDIARASQDTRSSTDSDRDEAPGPNMLDVYRQSLFSPNAENMGFVSPPRQHPHRNRFRTDAPMYHNDSQESETEGDSSDPCIEQQPVDTGTAANTSCISQASTPTATQQECGGSSASLWGEAEAPTLPTPASDQSQPRARAHRESSDGYAAELDSDAPLAFSESADADFDCGIDSLWD